MYTGTEESLSSFILAAVGKKKCLRVETRKAALELSPLACELFRADRKDRHVLWRRTEAAAGLTGRHVAGLD